MQTQNLSDIHSRLCEVVVRLIEQHGGFPPYNYVIKVKDDLAHIIGAIGDLKNVTFTKASNITHDLYLFWDEVKDLSVAVGTLLEYSDEQILHIYYNSFNGASIYSYIEILISGSRIFGSLRPNYRNKPPLKHCLDNTQINLVLCHISTMTNYIFPNNFPQPYLLNDPFPLPERSEIRYRTISLLPTHFAQSKFNEILISTVYYGVYCSNSLLQEPNIFQPFMMAAFAKY